MGKHKGDDDKRKYEEIKPEKNHTQDSEAQGGGRREKPAGGGKK